MRCPECGAHTDVLETRDTRRRRQCFNGHRFTTEETAVPERTRDWREVAAHPGRAVDVASKYGASVNTVYVYRSRLRDERRSA